MVNTILRLLWGILYGPYHKGRSFKDPLIREELASLSYVGIQGSGRLYHIVTIL